MTLDIPHNIDIHLNLPIVVTNKCAFLAAQAESESDSGESAASKEGSSSGGGGRRMGSKSHSTVSSTSSND